MFFLERSSQIQLFQNEKVIISHHKSTEVVKIVWFSHTSLLLLKKKSCKTDIFPVLRKLTHMSPLAAVFVSITVDTMQLHDVCYVIQGPPGYNLCPLRNKFHLCNLNSCTEISAGTIQSDKTQRFCQQHLNFKILIKCLQQYHLYTCWQEYLKYIF